MTEHGAVRLPAADEPVGECDWGGCDNPGDCFRWDNYGHGWLSCCSACARKPVVPRCNRTTRGGFLCDDEVGHGGSRCYSVLFRRSVS